jgi:iron complex transport system substrate-binding protein
VAYPKNAWGTEWRDMIRYNSMGMGMEAEGAALIGTIVDSSCTSVRYSAVIFTCDKHFRGIPGIRYFPKNR